MRVNAAVMERTDDKDIILHFPTSKVNARTHLVLKAPKTETSVRRVWLLKTLAFILRDWKKEQEELKEMLGNGYVDYDLVIAHNDGRPVDIKVIEHAFARLRERCGLPNVVFHSLRHASTTYKLNITHGNIKDVQGDTGHASASMVTDVYGHILDERRKENAKLFEQSFYQQPIVKPKQSDSGNNNKIDTAELLRIIQESPELKEALRELLNEPYLADRHER